MSNVVLAEPDASDATEFLAAVRDSRALHSPWVDPPDTEARFAAYLERATRPDQAAFLVRHRQCGGLVGYVHINDIVRGALQSGYLGFAGFASHTGRGLMTEGVGAALTHAFGVLSLHRVEANVQPGNTRSRRLIERLGFDREGFSPRYLRVEDDWRDHERWALRAEVWDPGSFR